MTQKRFVNYGTTVEAAKFKGAIANLVAPQVLSGGLFTPNNSGAELRIAPISVVFPSGLIMEETEDKVLALVDGVSPIVQSSAKQYTVYYTHTDEDSIGGSVAQLFLTSNPTGGNVFLQSVTNGVIIGWIDYPGGAIPLDPTMFYYPPKTKLASPISKGFGSFVSAPFPSPGTGIAWTSNTTSVVHGVSGNGMYTSFSGVGTAELYFGFVTDSWLPSEVDILMLLTGPSPSLTVRVYDELNTLVQFTDLSTAKTFSGPVSYGTNRVRFKTGTFTPGKIYKVRLNVSNANAGDTVLLYSVGTTPYNLPF